MNALDELLDGEEGFLDCDRLREARSTALHDVRHDRRVERLDYDQATELTISLFQSPDIRTLTRYTHPPRSVGGFKELLERTRNYENQLLFEVVDAQELQDEGVRQLQRIIVARGGQMRVADVPFRMHVYNRRFALVAADFDSTLGGAIAVREPDLVASFAELHARMWQQAQKWEAAGVDLADVLAELLAGGTDEVSAQRLNISLRTYRRKVQELLALLGVSSRFQAGAVADQRRYLDLVRPSASRSLDNHDLYDEALSRVR